MQLIIGFILGQALGFKNAFLVFLFLPLAFALVFGLGYGLWWGGNWYAESVSQPAVSSMWYSWPWNWPGASLSNSFLKSVNPLFETSLVASEDAMTIWGIASMMQNFVGALMAVMINVTVAALPLYILICVRSICCYIKSKRTALVDQTI